MSKQKVSPTKNIWEQSLRCPPASSNNLPLQLTKFVGRAQEIVEVRRLLSETRLLTLTGPGGVGKTRLSLEVAIAALGNFEDGIWWVELAPLSDPRLVVQEIVLVLGLSVESARSSSATLAEYLQNKNLLLLLDNCEHLITACAELVERLLRICPRLHFLVTSREAFGIDGETIWSVPPLSLPVLNRLPTFENLIASEAGQLFIERIQMVRPDFQITEKSAGDIVQICRLLDGIPLAIELAAARIKVLTISQIATGLGDGFRLLTGGSRTALPRHQTLRATMNWSYDLLSEPEQNLFRQLAVFAGGFSLEAAEAICTADAIRESQREGAGEASSLLDLLSHLVDKSLVQVNQNDEEARYQLLEIIRQYARERLFASGDMQLIHQRHLNYYLQLAEIAEPKVRGVDQLLWMNRLEVENDNLRAALDWSLGSGAIREGLLLAGALSVFWDRRGHLSEGSEWLDRILSIAHPDDLVLAKAIIGAAHLAWQQSNHKKALRLAEQSLGLYRRYDDKKGIARSLFLLGVVEHWLGDRNKAGSLLEESLGISRDINDELNTLDVLLYLGDIRLRQGENETAAALLQESLAISQKLGDKWGISFSLSTLGENARRQGDLERALVHFQQALPIQIEQKFKIEIPFTIEALSFTFVGRRDFERAARLWGAAEALREAIYAPLPSSYHADYAYYLNAIRSALGEETFAKNWAIGRALTLEQVAAIALSPPVAEIIPSTSPTKASLFGLTAREIDVLRLIAAGKSNQEIAAILVLSVRTVERHISNIYEKLSVSGTTARANAAAFAIRSGLT